MPVVLGTELERLKQEMMQASTANDVQIPQFSHANAFFLPVSTQQKPYHESLLCNQCNR
ncbi:hypothetical protein ACD661_11010 [Legionella lytica]|uniref:Uncharacterized protein n=1 Tax=Legionella lytica TaxID=96232 RepID=A0ABW8D8Q3_9GAMM